MRARCPRSRPLGVARLEGYRLAFAVPKDASPERPGWATLSAEPGAQTTGALFALHADDLATLDSFEDYPTLYTHEQVQVLRADGEAVSAMIYRMRPPLRYAPPTARYAETIRQGYIDFGLPVEALERALAEDSL